jgi:hypothetical protein
MIEYEFEGLFLEFIPENAYTKGYLTVTAGETVFGAKIDIASSKARGAFVKDARDLYPDAFEDELGLRRALNELSVHLTDQARSARAKAEEKVDKDGAGVDENRPEEGSGRYAAAMEILHSDDVLECAAEAMRILGHVGEWANKKLAFACAVSARAQLPVQPSTHAQSSAGKNYLWDTALALVPPELVYKRTGFSAKALFRTNMSLKHSVLYIQELAGSEGADFSIRTLQSDNVLKWEATEKQPDGTIANVEYEVEGPTVIVQTTTKNHLHPENETRVVPLYLDESAEQTERINREALRRAAGKGSISAEERAALCETWHDAVRLLEPAEVVLPFAERIEVPSTPLRLRRDVPRLLNIIGLVAWIHQRGRERDDEGRILATEDDFHRAIAMVGDSFARAWKALTPTEEKIYASIIEHVPTDPKKRGFKRSHVETALEKAELVYSTTVIKDALRSLVYQGFLESDGKRGASGSTYTVAKAASVMENITLAVHSSIHEKEREFGISKANLRDGDDIVHSARSVHSTDGAAAAETNGRNGRKRTDPKPSINSAQPSEKLPNGRMDGQNARVDTESEPSLDYEYSEDN